MSMNKKLKDIMKTFNLPDQKHAFPISPARVNLKYTRTKINRT